MKKVFLAGMLGLLLSFRAVGQQTPAYSFLALEQQVRMQRLNVRLSLAPAGGHSFGRYRLSTGPLFLLKEFPEAGRELPRFNGWQLAAEYQLKREEPQLIKKFFGFRSSLELLGDSWTANKWNNQAGVYQEYEVSSREVLWDHSLYGGALLQLPASLQLQVSLSLGYFHSYLRNQSSSTDRLPFTQDYRPYQEHGVSMGCALGVIYSWQQLFRKYP